MAIAGVSFGGFGVSDIGTQNSLRKAKQSMFKSMEKLSSGFRINSASDNAAALAIAEKMRAEVAALDAASRNVDYGSSLGAIADSAMSSQGDMAIRMRELAMQASNGTLSSSDRSALQAEFDQLRSEVDRVASTTQFNGRDVLQGGSVEFQVGTGSGSNNRITMDLGNTSASTLGLAGLDISNQANAQSALGDLDNAIASIASSRGSIGASMNRLNATRSNLASSVESTASSLSRIIDTDYGLETSKLAGATNMFKAGISVLSASNKAKGWLVNLVG